MRKIVTGTSRAQFASIWALKHLTASIVIACLAAYVVFGFWYGEPWNDLLGVYSIFGMLVAVDVIAGPLLTGILASPKKTRRERWVDLSLVALIQLGALGYGMWSVYAARPVILAFEVDRLVVITANEVQIDQLPDAIDSFQELPWTGPKMVSLRNAYSSDEFLESLEQSIQGITQAMRPRWWRPIYEAKPQMLKRAKPLQSLIDSRPSDRNVLVKAAARSGIAISDLLYLPLTSTKVNDWLVLISQTGEIVGHAHIDAFD